MRVLVCGSRDYTNYTRVFEVLDYAHAQQPITCVIDGAARGADTCAWEWALRNGVYSQRFPADWPKHGRKAGPVRNYEMLQLGAPDLVIGFFADISNKSPGTMHMLTIADAAGVPVWVF